MRDFQSGESLADFWAGFERAMIEAGMVPVPGRLAATGINSIATGSSTVDSLLWGMQWTGTITYSFPDSVRDYEYGYAEAANGFSAVSLAQMQAARFILEGTSAYVGGPRMALAPVEGLTNVSIVDAGRGDADIRIGRSYSGGDTAYAYMPSSHPYGGDIWFGRKYDYSKPKVGNYEFATMIHELGHALGLKHAHELDGLSGSALPASRDSLEYTVMTYHSYVPKAGQAAPKSGYTNETYGFPQTYMMYDIAALQAMYGADFGFRSSNTVYRWSPTTGETFANGVGQGAPGDGIGGSANRIFLTIWDGGGTDTYDFSNYSTKVSINLKPGAHVALPLAQRAYLGDGHYARGNIFNALQFEGDARSLIENAKGGSGSDSIRGNAVKNVLRGNAGNDSINGDAGNDVLVGGSGADKFVFSTMLDARTNVDRITDFSVVSDTIRLSKSIFTSLPKTGTLSKSYFKTGTAARDSNDFIVYNKTTGALSYDPDGTGTLDAIKFAQLKAGLGLTSADFYVV